MKILIIDDDEDLIEALKVILEKNSYEVFSALSGQEGLKKAQEIHPDLILLDVMMETNSAGFDLSRLLKKDAVLCKTPILMMTAIKEKTGMGFKDEAGDETWLPVDDYVEKPISAKDLLERVKKLLGR